MSSTLRILPQDKMRLGRLQEAWQRLRGERPSQQDLVGKAIAYADAHRDDFLAQSAWRPLTPEQVAAAHELVTDMGPWSVADGVDDVVYS
jgi:hypothetical protein